MSFNMNRFNEAMAEINKKNRKNCEGIAQIGQNMQTAVATAPTINMQAFNTAIENIQQHNSGC